MGFNFNELPVVLALAVLVAVFAAISRHRAQERVGLWLAGWVLVLLRSVTEFARFRAPWAAKLELAVGLCALEMGSLAFVVSVAPKTATWRRQLALSLVLGVPILLYTNAMLWDVSARGFYYATVTLGFGAVLALVWIWYRTITTYVLSIVLALAAVAGLLFWGIAAGKEEFGMDCILAAMNFFAAGLYWYRLRRASAGVLTTVFGFVAWGVTLPTGVALRTLAPRIPMQSEAWNIPKYLLAVGMIVTLLEDQIIESDHLAYHDPLTGLPNRRLLQDRLVQAFARADRAGHKVAVLFLDLDDFKEVNDTFGHRVGDAALQQVVARLSARVRGSDTLARTGGDEFTIVSEVATAEGAQALASALKSALIAPLKVEEKLVRTSLSVGYALYPQDATDPIALCAAADKAMYAAKRNLAPAKSGTAQARRMGS